MSGDNKPHPAQPSTKTPDAKTASQWLTDALNDARRNTHDHGHVEYLIQRQSAGKISIDLS